MSAIFRLPLFYRSGLTVSVAYWRAGVDSVHCTGKCLGVESSHFMRTHPTSQVHAVLAALWFWKSFTNIFYTMPFYIRARAILNNR
jgi:hypothetical protein